MKSVPPYHNVVADHRLVHAGRSFRVIVYGGRQQRGQCRLDLNGLAILDDDFGFVLADCILQDEPAQAHKLCSTLCAEDLSALVATVNTAPNARFHLSPNGDLLDRGVLAALS